MVRKDRRQQIYSASLKLFDERGYYGTGMGDVAKAIGMATSSLYNHYASKQEILAEIMENSMEELLRHNARALVGLSAPEEKLRACMKAHVKFHAENQNAVRVSNKELDSLEEPARSVVLQLRKDYAARWLTVIEEGIESDSFQAQNPKILSWALIDMGSGVSNWYTDAGALSIDELATMYADLAVRQVRS